MHRERYTHIEFQFLIGILKTSKSSSPLVLRECVSIPYRYSKNFNQLRQNISCRLVSIPYRYSKNEKPVTVSIYLFAEFQFLIGILKTCRLRREQHESKNRFQFLIGILKTQTARVRWTIQSKMVSIPYRYSKN